MRKPWVQMLVAVISAATWLVIHPPRSGAG